MTAYQKYSTIFKIYLLLDIAGLKVLPNFEKLQLLA